MRQPTEHTLDPIVAAEQGGDELLRRRPADGTYRLLHWSLMGIVAAVLLYGLLVARFVPTPRGVGFRLVVTLLIVFNILWWSIADRRFARHIRSPRLSRLCRLIAAGFSAALSIPLWYLLVSARSPEFLNAGPAWYAAAFVLWNVSLAAALPLVALIRLAALGIIHLAKTGQRVRSHESAATDCTLAATRRAFLKTSFATAPMALLTGMLVTSRVQEGSLAIHRHRLSAPWLPSRLHGLTITHLSDLHVGRHYRPYMLRELVDKVGSLNSDIVVVTGDVVDMSNDMLPPALHALGQITHRHGMFICIGNHDEIDSRAEYIRAVGPRFPLLVNEFRTLRLGGERLTIGGLDYSGSEEPSSRRAGHNADAAALLSRYDPERDGPMIALAHHPHAFDVLAAKGIPLTLSGHTHGGQLMLSSPDSRPDIGIGRLLFRYTRGFYYQNNAALFVNSGVGNWFPLRVHAPAEVVQIQLTA